MRKLALKKTVGIIGLIICLSFFSYVVSGQTKGTLRGGRNPSKAIALLKQSLEVATNFEEREDVITGFLISRPDLTYRTVPTYQKRAIDLLPAKKRSLLISKDKGGKKSGTFYVSKLMRIIERLDEDTQQEVLNSLHVSAALDNSYTTDHFRIHYTNDDADDDGDGRTGEDGYNGVDGFQGVDDDGDSQDSDGDGYCDGQELRDGTDPNDSNDHPSMPPENFDNWIDEDPNDKVPQDDDNGIEDNDQHPDFIERVGEYLEYARDKYDSWGYNLGHTDLKSRYQVHVKSINSLGVTYPVPATGGSSIDVRNSVPPNEIMFGSNYFEWDTGDDSNLVGTTAHEYHHACQNKYLFISALLSKQWVVEGSAAWAEHEVVREKYPNQNIEDLDWFKSWVDMYLDEPFRDLSTSDWTRSGDPDGYPTGMYWYFLADNTKVDFAGGGKGQGDRAINQIIWEKLATNSWALVNKAFDDALSSAPSKYDTFRESFLAFSEANAGKDLLSSQDNWYEGDAFDLKNVMSGEGAKEVNLANIDLPKIYPSSVNADVHSLEGWASFYFMIRSDSSKDIRLKFDGEDDKFLDNKDFTVKVLRITNGDLDKRVKFNLDDSKNEDALTLSMESKDKVLVCITKTDGSSANYSLKVYSLDILKPTNLNQVVVGPHDHPRKVDIEVKELPPGLDVGDFSVEIGGKAVDVISSQALSDGYELKIQPPVQPSNGEYDLKVTAKGMSDTEENSIKYTSRANVDVPLVLDRSGSMGGQKIKEARSAATQFVSLMDTGDMIGVVSFATNATQNYSLTEITSQNIKDQAQNAINNISSGRYTSIGDGLYTGQSQLGSNGNSSHDHAIVLMSDGWENEPRYVSGVLPGIPDKTDVYTVAFGSSPDAALLKDIATETGGKYYKTHDNRDISNIYNRIAAVTTGQQTIASKSATVDEGSTSTIDTIVDSTVSKVSFVLGWSGSDLDLTLEDPSGNTIDPNSASSDPDISYSSGSTFEIYKIESPNSRDWKMQVEGVSTPSGGEPYSANVTADSDLTFDTNFGKSQYTEGQPITILASLSEGTKPLTGANVSVRVQPPAQSTSSWKSINGDTMPTEGREVIEAELTAAASNSTTQLTLYDDGQHGDGQANDGVYGNYYQQTTKSGSYIFKFDASGTTTQGDKFTRTTQRSTFVEQASASGSIEGNISYAGKESGEVYVRAWVDDSTLSGNPDYQTSISSPGSYQLGGLPDGLYYIRAFVDSDGNGEKDADEPSAIKGSGTPDPVQVSGGNAVKGIDIALCGTLVTGQAPPESHHGSPDLLDDVDGNGDTNSFDAFTLFKSIAKGGPVVSNDPFKGRFDFDKNDKTNSFDAFDLFKKLARGDYGELGVPVAADSMDLQRLATSSIGESSTANTSVMLESVPRGLVGYKLTLETPGGEIEKVELPAFDEPKLVEGLGSSQVTVAAADFDQEVGPGAEGVTLAKVKTKGSGRLNLKAHWLDDDEGSSYELEEMDLTLVPTGAESLQPTLSQVVVRPGSLVKREEVTFVARGKYIKNTRVRVFDMQGQAVYDSGFKEGRKLSWDLSAGGTRVSNGIYLYAVTVKGFGGGTQQGDVRKLLILG